MNPGFLKMMVVQQLLKEPCSGYTLVKRIAERTGWKPSFGSIYPLLERMQEQGLITAARSGRSKLYSLTPMGKKTFNEQRDKRRQAMANIVEQLSILASLGDDEAGVMASMLTQRRAEGIPMKELPEAVLMRKEIFRIVQEDKVQQNQKKLREIFARTMKELKTI